MIKLPFFRPAPQELPLDIKSLADNLAEAVLIYNESFLLHYLNPAAEKKFNLKKEGVVGKKITPQDAENPRLASLVETLFSSLAPKARLLSVPGIWPQKSEIETSSGAVFTSTLVRLSDSAGGSFFLKILEDKNAEVAAQKDKKEFIGVAAHQIRTPLTALHWALEQLAKESSGTAKDLAAQALELSERALKTANDLLDAARLEDGRLELSLEPADLNEIISAAVKELYPLAENKQVRIIWAPQPPLVLKIDPNKIGFVIANLLDNAIKYNVLNGQVEVTLERVGAGAKISVRDTGVGMADEELGHLFEKLWRGGRATSLEPNGSGLGLYIAKNIVTLHGGRIGAQSTPNRGSLFWLTLPAPNENPGL